MENLQRVPKAPEGFHQRLVQTLDSLPERKEGTPVKHKHLTKILAAAAVAAVLAVGAFAAGQLWTISSSSHADDFYKLPTAAWAEAQLGAEPVLLEKFSNGYAFESGSVVKNSLTSESGAVQNAYTSLDLSYRSGTERVYLELSGAEDPAGPDAEAIERDGMTLYYSSFTQKYVPHDYELTAKDQAAVDAGEIVIAYGGDGELMAWQNLRWRANGVSYALCGHDMSLTREQMVEMACELMAAE